MRCRALILAGALALARVAQAQAIVEPDRRYMLVADLLEDMIRHEMRDKGIPALSIALVDSQRVIWARGFGWADSAKGVRATAETVYRVGSVSKLFTDLAVMQLVERGALSLDADVSRYITTFKPRNPYAKPITLRQLMSHRAGLVREPPVGNYFDTSRPSLGATVASLNGTALVYPPESTAKYSNAGIAVVGYLLERVRGTPFVRYVKSAVLAPIDMRGSAFEPTADVKSHLSQAQMWTLHGRTFDAPTFELGMSPAGSMYASVLDMTQFIRALLRRDERLVKSATLDTMWTPQYAPGATSGFGLGFAVGQYAGRRVVRHGGAIYGFATELVVMPDEQLGVIVAAAKDGANVVAGRIAMAALESLRAQRSGAALSATERTHAIPQALADRAEGLYTAGDRALRVVRYDSTLYLHSEAAAGQSRLRWLQGDTLIVDDALDYGARVVVGRDTLAFEATRFGRVTGGVIPNEAPERFRGLIGEYGWDHNTLYIYEQGGRLRALIEWFFDYPLTELRSNVFAFPNRGLYPGEQLIFARNARGRATKVTAANVVFPRRNIPGEEGTAGAGVFRIKPLKPIPTLRREALVASPPNETGDFRPSDLVELTTLDPSIKLDIRYAGRDNFLSTPVYSQARAFMQRPAAEALVRAHRALAARGYGLLIHDGYRPWYVTKIFWDATPASGKIFVADPSQGSRHNRGCAVDLTLYDLATGKAVAMPGGYDEMSDRSYPMYPGGTTRQRALRELLRAAMEREGFRVFDAEWWHFDYKDWRLYRIGNKTFEEMGR